jgi:uncharacterized protein YgiB involved in biofilm formation
MKRSTCVQLSLSAAVALAVSGCQAPEKQYEISKTFNFNNVQQCVDQKIPVDVCSDAYMTALSEHRRIAPIYTSQAECDADFIENYCRVDSSGRFTPPLSGFQLSADGQVSESQLSQARTASGEGSQAGMSGGGGNMVSNVVMGMLIGNMLSNNRGRYYSEPVYRYRDDRGGFGNSTLAKRINSGATFKNSTQARSGVGYTASATRPTINTRPVSVKSTTSRGGFGSQASARSGWGGSRSFGG